MYAALSRLILKFAIPIFLVLIAVLIGVGLYGYTVFSKPSKSSHQLSIEKIERMGKLELVRITTKDVLQQTKERPFGLPNAKMLLIVVGQASIGIDLQKVKKEDFTDTETQVTVTLPKPEILMWKVDHKASKVYDTTLGGFSTAELQEEAWKSAEEVIRLSAADGTYFDLSKKNAVILLTPIFQELAGKKKVAIAFRS